MQTLPVSKGRLIASKAIMAYVLLLAGVAGNLTDRLIQGFLIPYEQQHVKIEGTVFTCADDSALRRDEGLLERRKANAEKIKQNVEEWMLTIPARMQRIIRWKLFEGLTWEETAAKLGRKATGDSVRMEFTNFMK